MGNYVPREFAKKPRPIQEKDCWKATEFRQFLLYTEPVVLADELPDEMYKNFLLLSVAIYIMLSPSLSLQYSNYALELSLLFVQKFSDMYGKDQIVYNVHEDVRDHIEKDLINFANDNPGVVLYLKPRKH
ncbi:uncharacterized protein LOC143020471 [Oratosquilla oratoria]|uniref:uncharacterized protein LOC143020471 n=1 Tax=Oratosquilla oratoria TaxID=337810 RepID=UPI003F76DE83